MLPKKALTPPLLLHISWKGGASYIPFFIVAGGEEEKKTPNDLRSLTGRTGLTLSYERGGNQQKIDL